MNDANREIPDCYSETEM